MMLGKQVQAGRVLNLGASGMKPKTCKHCSKEFAPFRPMQTVCSTACAAKAAKKHRTEAAKTERVEFKKRKEAIKTIPQLIKEAQVIFNAWVRERDRQAGYPCISSGRALDWSGNAVDAGHFRSTGAASHIRFNEDNCHAQSKHDNQYLAGNAVEYRIRLVYRIGIERVEALESSNTPHKWTREELIGIRAMYTAKLKELKKS